MYENPLNKFRDELNPGERVIWNGQPQQGLMLQRTDLYMIPFSFLWGGFAIFWEFTAISNGAPFFFLIWGIPFILVGLYMIVGRFFVDSIERKNTFYALTNERAIIISGIYNQTTRSLDINKLPEINMTKLSDGRETITFGPLHPMAWMYAGNGFSKMNRINLSPSFDRIDEVSSVYRHIKNLQRENV